MPLSIAEQAAPSATANYGKVFVDTSNRLAYLDEAGTASVLARGIPVRKTAETQVVNTSTTLVNDDALLYAIAANEIWAGYLTLFVSCNASGGIKVAITVPTGATLRMGAELYATTTVSNIDPTTVSATAIGATAAITKVNMQVLVANGANAGNVQLQWAQNASHASDTKILVNSFLTAQRIA